jgi:hypothetical protein
MLAAANTRGSPESCERIKDIISANIPSSAFADKANRCLRG